MDEIEIKEIKNAIRALSKYKYRSISNVAGEFVEKQIAHALKGVQASHCQKGFDVFCESLGKIEVKSRNANAKSMQCTLPRHKLETFHNFILAIVNDGEIEKVLLFRKDALLSIQSSSGIVYVNKQNFGIAEDVTKMFKPN